MAVSLAAIGGVVAASSCCLPWVPVVMAAGLAGTSAFLGQMRPYLLSGSILLLGGGFYQAARAKKCQRRTSRIAQALLWLSAGFVFVSLFFPQMMANLIAGWGAR